MRPIFMDVYSAYVFTVHIAAGVISPVNHQAAPSPVRRLAGKHRAEQAGADYEVIVTIQIFSLLILRN